MCVYKNVTVWVKKRGGKSLLRLQVAFMRVQSSIPDCKSNIQIHFPPDFRHHKNVVKYMHGLRGFGFCWFVITQCILSSCTFGELGQ